MLATLSAAALLIARTEMLADLGLSRPPPGERFGKSIPVIDLSTPLHHPRSLRLSPEAAPAVIIESVCARPQILDKIDLLAGDADVRLQRYALAGAPERG